MRKVQIFLLRCVNRAAQTLVELVKTCVPVKWHVEVRESLVSFLLFLIRFVALGRVARRTSPPYTPPKKTYKHVIVNVGHGFSGSGTVLDFLTEFDNCTIVGHHSYDGAGKLFRSLDKSQAYEVDLMARPGGILELEEAIESGNANLKSSAMRRFAGLIEWHYWFNGYPFYNDEFLRLSRKFVDSLIEVKWPRRHLVAIRMTGLTLLGKSDSGYRLKKMSRSEYRALAKEYLHNIFSTIESGDYLLLDQFLSDGNSSMDSKLEYFEDIKVVGVWRDPRDIFATGVLCTTDIPRVPAEFIKWYNGQWIKQINHPQCLVIRFEDFVLNYDSVAPKVMEFLGLSEKNHIHKRGFFDPSVSRKNIGLYKKIQDQDAIRQIEKELSDFIYRGDES